MARLELRLLGGFQARLGAGLPLALPAKAQALLAYLALRPGAAHPRDKIAALLWGATSDAQARANLRHTVFTLRKALGETALQTDGHTLAVEPNAVDVDAGTFERLVDDGTSDALERAGKLYEGDLLDGLVLAEPAFEEWLLAERERLRERAVEALTKLLAHQMREPATEHAIQTAMRLLALEPLQEAVRAQALRGDGRPVRPPGRSSPGRRRRGGPSVGGRDEPEAARLPRTPAWCLSGPDRRERQGGDVTDVQFVRDTLDDLEHERRLTRVPVPPMSRSETESLARSLARTGSPETILAQLGARVWELSGGNPFVGVEAMRALGDFGSTPLPAALPLPERVRQAIGRRLDSLQQASRTLASVAAVIGRAFEFALARHASGLGPEDAAAAVEELVRKRLLHGVGDRFDFTHDRIREVIAERDEAWWLGMSHWLVAAARTLMAELAAAQAAATQVLEIGEALGDPRLECYGLWTLGWIAAARGDGEPAVALCERALARAPDPTDQMNATAAFGYVLLERGEAAAAIPRLEEAVAHIRGWGVRRSQGLFLVMLADAYRAAGRLDAAREAAEEALRIWRDSEYPYAKGWAERTLGRIAEARGSAGEARDRLTAALATFGSIEARLEVGRTHLDLARVERAAGDADGAGRHLGDARALFSALDLSRWLERTPQVA